ADGKEQTFKALKGEKGTVVIFLSVQCPVVKGYNERINQIFNEYKSKGIAFIGINSNSTESPEQIGSHARETYGFPVLIDKGNVLADELNASVTPEVFLFDSNGKLIYKGAIDNDRSGKNITENYLRDALDGLLMKKAIAKASTKAFGCTIKRTEEKVKPETTSITIRRTKVS
ncbi:MAG: redoxin family protein, partial [Pyrinomonadaceae bacterium]